MDKHTVSSVKPSFQTPYKSSAVITDQLTGTVPIDKQRTMPVFLPKAVLMSNMNGKAAATQWNNSGKSNSSSVKNRIDGDSGDNKEMDKKEINCMNGNSDCNIVKAHCEDQTSETVCEKISDIGTKLSSSAVYCETPVATVGCDTEQSDVIMETSKPETVSDVCVQSYVNVIQKHGTNGLPSAPKDQRLEDGTVKTDVSSTDVKLAVTMETHDLDLGEFSEGIDEEDMFYCMLAEARRCQMDIINSRKKETVKPVAGRLWKMKESAHYRNALKDVIDWNGNVRI